MEEFEPDRNDEFMKKLALELSKEPNLWLMETLTDYADVIFFKKDWIWKIDNSEEYQKTLLKSFKKMQDVFFKRNYDLNFSSKKEFIELIENMYVNINTADLNKYQEREIITILHSKELSETIMTIATYWDREIAPQIEKWKYSINNIIKKEKLITKSN